MTAESDLHPPAGPSRDSAGLSRRRLLGASAGAALAGAAVGVGSGYAASRAAAQPVAGGASLQNTAATVAGPDAAVDFLGPHQAGIVTPAQDRMHFVALDIVTTDRAVLVDLLKRWTRAAQRMTAGAEATPGGVAGGGPYGVPTDTGEAYGLPASGLTLTIGFGPSLFDGRFGLADRKPDALQELPAFRGDQLDPKRSGGDLCIQACANDPQVAVHAVRNLIRLGFGVVSVRWSQLGFGRTSSTSTTQVTPRNMFGFKDGTANLKAEETAAVDDHVWVAPGDVTGRSTWMAGGTYLVARRIRMHIEVWDRSNLQDQEQTIGRTKLAGEPLGRDKEFDTPDFAAKGADGAPAIPVTSHVALAAAENPSGPMHGVRMLRRGYNFTDGTDGVGHLDAGLFFIAFVRNPQTQFVAMQRVLAEKDRLNEYIEHNGSAIFACPPGLSDGGYWGEALFG